MAGSGSERLFMPNISSFGQLIAEADKGQVFSDYFLDFFSEDLPGNS